MLACVNERACVLECLQTCPHKGIYAFVRICLPACVRACVCVRALMRGCMHICVCVHACMCVHVCVCEFLRGMSSHAGFLADLATPTDFISLINHPRAAAVCD